MIEYDHTVGCTIIGGPTYRGPALPALDGTTFSEQAVPWAVSLARRSGASINLATVEVPPDLGGEAGPRRVRGVALAPGTDGCTAVLDLRRTDEDPRSP